MNIFYNLLILVIVLLSWPIGKFLAKLTSEEVKSGRHYFRILRNVVLILVIVMLFYFSAINFMVTTSLKVAGIVLGLVLLALFLFSFKATSERKENAIFALLIVSVAYSFYLISNATFLLSALAFIYGLVSRAWVFGDVKIRKSAKRKII
ncbi:MAG: hypothetical protein AABX59_04155 [Nanoarchaeota archaeon]